MIALLSVLVLAMGPFTVPADTPALCADQPGQIEMAFGRALQREFHLRGGRPKLPLHARFREL